MTILWNKKGFPFDLGSIVYKNIDGKKVYGKVYSVEFTKKGVKYKFKPFKKPTPKATNK